MSNFTIIPPRTRANGQLTQQAWHMGPTTAGSPAGLDEPQGETSVTGCRFPWRLAGDRSSPKPLRSPPERELPAGGLRPRPACGHLRKQWLPGHDEPAGPRAPAVPKAVIGAVTLVYQAGRKRLCEEAFKTGDATSAPDHGHRLQRTRRSHLPGKRHAVYADRDCRGVGTDDPFARRDHCVAAVTRTVPYHRAGSVLDPHAPCAVPAGRSRASHISLQRLVPALALTERFGKRAGQAGSARFGSDPVRGPVAGFVLVFP